MPPSSPERPRSIPTLDGWRAIAILLVLASHAAMGFYATEAEYYAGYSQFGGSVFGIGVDIFFGLSGLLITLILLDEVRDMGAIRIKAFYIRRAFRILPPAFAYIAIVGAAGLIVSWPELAGSLFFFRNYVPSVLVAHTTQHLWSLSVEEHFYLVWPVLLVIAGSKRAKTLAVVLCLACGLWRMLLASGTLPDPFSGVPIHFRTDRRFDALLWGCVMAFLVHDPAQRTKLAAQLRGWRVGIPVILAIACLYMYSHITSMLLALLIPAVLAGTALNANTRLGRVLDLPPLRWIGRISYSLYLWQQLFLVAGWAPRALVQTWPLNICAVFGCAILSYYTLERPLIAYGRRIAEAQKPLEPSLIRELS